MQAYRGQGAHMFRSLRADWVAGNVQLLQIIVCRLGGGQQTAFFSLPHSPNLLVVPHSFGGLTACSGRIACLRWLLQVGGGWQLFAYSLCYKSFWRFLVAAAQRCLRPVQCSVMSPCLSDYQTHRSVAAVHAVASWF